MAFHFGSVSCCGSSHSNNAAARYPPWGRIDWFKRRAALSGGGRGGGFKERYCAKVVRGNIPASELVWLEGKVRRAAVAAWVTSGDALISNSASAAAV